MNCIMSISPKEYNLIFTGVKKYHLCKKVPSRLNLYTDKIYIADKTKNAVIGSFSVSSIIVCQDSVFAYRAYGKPLSMAFDDFSKATANVSAFYLLKVTMPTKFPTPLPIADTFNMAKAPVSLVYTDADIKQVYHPQKAVQ